jgi:hypothetical protein
MGAVSHGTERSTGSENVRSVEHGHEGHECAQASAVNPNPPGIGILLIYRPPGGVYLKLQVLAAPVAAYGGLPLSSISGRRPVIGIEHQGRTR